MDYFKLVFIFGLSILFSIKAIRDGRRMKRTGEIELSSSHSMALARHTRRYGEEAGRIRRQEFLERLKRTRYPDHLIAGGGLSLSLTIMILVFAVIAILGVSGN